jgi:hypothetical protein
MINHAVYDWNRDILNTLNELEIGFKVNSLLPQNQLMVLEVLAQVEGIRYTLWCVETICEFASFMRDWVSLGNFAVECIVWAVKINPIYSKVNSEKHH